MQNNRAFEIIGNRYELNTMLGQGGMGAVYKAIDLLTGQTVALKRVTTLTETMDADSVNSVIEFRLALAREFKTLASLRHPQIITVLDYGFDEGGFPYFTMELLPESQGFLQAGRIEKAGRQIELVVELLQALAYLHRRGILHRDLKPGNVLITREGQLKVLDFGLAAKSEELENIQEIAGTLNYMAPEIFRGQPVSKASDLYAVGVMAYELFVGRHPFQNYLDRLDRLIRATSTTEPDLSGVYQWEQATLTQLSPSASILSEMPDDTARAEDYPDVAQDTTAFDEGDLDGATVVGVDIPIYGDAVDLDAKTVIGTDLGDLSDMPDDKTIIGKDTVTRPGDVDADVEKTTVVSPGDLDQTFSMDDDSQWHDSDFNRTAIDPASVESELWIDFDSDTDFYEELESPQTLADVIGRLLQREPRMRYNDAYGVINDLVGIFGQIVPEESAAIRESFLQAATFVGRERELEQLNQALKAILRDENRTGSAWLVSGESGVGKSRLLDELRTRALVQGVTVLRGQAVAEGGVPYQLWREPLRRLLLSTEVDDVDASILKDVVPDIEQLLRRPVQDAPEVEDTAYKQRLIGTITSVFQRQTIPMFLLLEDLQWTVESLDVLKILKDMVESLPLLIVGSFRNDERPNLPEELPGMPVLRLDRLAREEIVELSVSMLGEVGRRKAVQDLLQRETEGNVFFLVEVVRTLAEEAGRLSDVGRMALPETVLAGGIEQIVQRRLERVPVQDRVLLELAAVAGREIDLDMLQMLIDKRAYPPLPKISLDAWLTTCTNSGVIEVVDGDWHFTHDKLRQGMLKAVDETVRPDLHRAVATAIELTYPDSSEQFAVLAGHWRAANDAGKELFYTQKSGDYSLHISAFSDAIKHFSRSLELLSIYVPPDTDVKELEAELLIKLGEAHENQGDYTEALANLEQGLASSREIGNQSNVGRALSVLGDVAWRQGEYQKAITLCEESVQVCEQIDDQRGIARALNRIGMVYYEQGEYANATAYLERSVHLARQSDYQPGIATAMNNLGLIAFAQGDYDNAARYFQETLELARMSGERRKVAIALLNLGVIAGEQGDYPSATHYFQETLSMCQAIGERRGVGLALKNLGGIAEYQQDYLNAEYYYEQSLDLSRAMGERQAIAATMVKLGHIARLQDERDRAVNVYVQALQLATEIDATPTIVEIIGGLAGVIQDRTFALQLLGLVLNHPALFDNMRRDIEQILDKVQEGIPEDEVESALEQGKQLDLEVIIADILQA